MEEERIKAYWHHGADWSEFHFWWRRLEGEGRCDTWGSEEWWRVIRAWLADGRPTADVRFYIIEALAYPFR